jgi:chaperonin cofactor prefoldin
VREKIQKAISEYKEKEEAYRKKMESVNMEISKVQENLQQELKTGTIG